MVDADNSLILYRYVSIEDQGHFFTLTLGKLHMIWNLKLAFLRNDWASFD